MAEYEMVHEIKNMCRNNQMRDVFFREVETEDPEAYVRSLFPKKDPELTCQRRDDGSVTVFAACDGMNQKFVFTPI